MKSGLRFSMILFTFGAIAQLCEAAAQAASTASVPKAQAQKHSQSQQATPQATTTPPAPVGTPLSVSPNTYRGAEGKKKASGTACSTARLKKDGTLDCGMSGKAAAPPRPE